MIDKEFEYHGVWWLPDIPDNRVSGIFSYKPNKGGSLVLNGYFKKIEIEELNELHEKPLYHTIIHGDCLKADSREKEKITLLKCYNTNFSCDPFNESLFYSSFEIDTVFLGTHLGVYEDIQFKKISIRFNSFDHWVDSITGFKTVLRKGNAFTINYKKPDSYHIKINDSIRMLIEFGSENILLPMVKFAREARIKEDCYLAIEYIHTTHYVEYLRIMTHIRLLLSVAMQQPIYPLAMIARNNENEKIKILQCKMSYTELNRKRHPAEMLFTFSELGERLGIILGNLIGKSKELDPIFSIYNEITYESMPLVLRFLRITQALESYHDIRDPDTRVKYLPDEQYGIIANKIKGLIAENTIDEHFISIMNYILESANTFGIRRVILRTRLINLLEKYDAIVAGIIYDSFGFVSNKYDLADIVIKSRNDYTHPRIVIEKKGVSGIKLFYISEILKLLLEICLLDEMGFSYDEMAESFSDKWKGEINFLKRQIEKLQI